MKNDVQKFTYTRKVLPFVEINGWGKSVGEHTKGDGTSRLHSILVHRKRFPRLKKDVAIGNIARIKKK